MMNSKYNVNIDINNFTNPNETILPNKKESFKSTSSSNTNGTGTFNTIDLSISANPRVSHNTYYSS